MSWIACSTVRCLKTSCGRQPNISMCSLRSSSDFLSRLDRNLWIGFRKTLIEGIHFLSNPPNKIDGHRPPNLTSSFEFSHIGRRNDDLIVTSIKHISVVCVKADYMHKRGFSYELLKKAFGLFPKFINSRLDDRWFIKFCNDDIECVAVPNKGSLLQVINHLIFPWP